MRPIDIRTGPGADVQIPVEYQGLYDLAYNLWWTWNDAAIQLFRRLDPGRWQLYRNPVELLINVEPHRWDSLLVDGDFAAAYHDVLESFRDYLTETESTWFRERYPDYDRGPIAYFSTEFGWHECLSIYSGGLGILAGDHCKSASDLGLPFIGVGLMYARGYFHQTIDADGHQQHHYVDNDFRRVPVLPVITPSGHSVRVSVEMAGREVSLRLWKAMVGRVPVILLDSDVRENHPADRPITSILYIRGREMRLSQEILLGMGGVRALRALGIEPSVWHLNEGHSALLNFQRIEEYVRAGVAFDDALERVTFSTVFTTHTPVPAGNESFEGSLILQYLGKRAATWGITAERLLQLGDGQTPAEHAIPPNHVLVPGPVPTHEPAPEPAPQPAPPATEPTPAPASEPQPMLAGGIELHGLAKELAQTENTATRAESGPAESAPAEPVPAPTPPADSNAPSSPDAPAPAPGPASPNANGSSEAGKDANAPAASPMDLPASTTPFNLTAWALRSSRFANGVSAMHGRVAQEMWSRLEPLARGRIEIGHITNGVHAPTWIGPEIAAILRAHLGSSFDQNLDHPGFLDAVAAIPSADLWKAHLAQKRRLIHVTRQKLRDQYARHGRSPEVLRDVDSILEDDKLTIGFARRFATYKRASLLFHDRERLTKLVQDAKRPIQVVFAGKAHPADRPGQQLIREIVEISLLPAFHSRVVFLEDYDMGIAHYLVQGVDLWLNTPRRPQEASGTSGMKAAMNGVLNLSILDGWWCEGFDPTHGWTLGQDRDYADAELQDREDAQSLGNVLSEQVIPCFYENGGTKFSEAWVARMKRSIGMLAPRFNTSRMVREYAERYYLPASQD